MREASRRLVAAAVLLGLMTASAVAQQPAWPSRAVTLVVPFQAGGSADILARATADHISAAIGQSVIVDNRGGAGGNVAAAAAAKAPADGYTIFFGSTGPTATNVLVAGTCSCGCGRGVDVRQTSAALPTRSSRLSSFGARGKSEPAHASAKLVTEGMGAMPR